LVCDLCTCGLGIFSDALQDRPGEEHQLFVLFLLWAHIRWAYLRKAFLWIFESAHLFRKFSVTPRNSDIGFFNHLWRLHDFNLLLSKILFDGLFKFNLINFGGTGLLLNRRGLDWRRKTLLGLLKEFKDERGVYFWLNALWLRG